MAQIYAKILELPFHYCFAYDHWLKSVQALLQIENLLYVTRLGIIESFELDYNGMLKYLLGKRFTYFEQTHSKKKIRLF